ncbi:hypothetical protein [Edaphocola flava]|uniref:hypothetical protein n=1 Tax=Edaphocola flava TaxID=2499629 RepID=UPI00100AD047|nr:hypothetical protein [Edaphocola flava]
MQQYFDHIKNHIDENGIVQEGENVTASLQAAIALGEKILGCTLVVNGKRFIIRMLELYYGGAGDTGHDWYRCRYSYKTSKYKEQTDVQNQQGFAVYLSSGNVEDAYTRMDIVAGHGGVPVSFLLRSVWEESADSMVRIGSYAGSPHTVLKQLALLPEHHGAKIAVDQLNADIYIDTMGRDALLQREQLTVLYRKRINLKLEKDFENQHKVLLNMFLEKDVPGSYGYSKTYNQP